MDPNAYFGFQTTQVKNMSVGVLNSADNAPQSLYSSSIPSSIILPPTIPKNNPPFMSILPNNYLPYTVQQTQSTVFAVYCDQGNSSSSNALLSQTDLSTKSSIIVNLDSDAQLEGDIGSLKSCASTTSLSDEISVRSSTPPTQFKTSTFFPRPPYLKKSSISSPFVPMKHKRFTEPCTQGSLISADKRKNQNEDLILSLWKQHQEELDNYIRHPETHPNFEFEKSNWFKHRHFRGFDTTSDAVTREWKKYWNSYLAKYSKKSWPAKCLGLDQTSDIGGYKQQTSKPFSSSLDKYSSSSKNIIMGNVTPQKNRIVPVKNRRSQSPRHNHVTSSRRSSNTSPMRNRTSFKSYSNSLSMNRSCTPTKKNSTALSRRNNITSSQEKSIRSRTPTRKRSRTPSRRKSRAPSRRKSRTLSRRNSSTPSRRKSSTPSGRKSSTSSKRNGRTPTRRKSRTPLRKTKISASKMLSITSSREKKKSLSRRRNQTSRRNKREPSKQESSTSKKKKQRDEKQLKLKPNLSASSRPHDVNANHSSTERRIHSEIVISDSSSCDGEESSGVPVSKVPIYEYVELFDLLKQMPGKFGSVSNCLGVLHDLILKAVEANKSILEVIDEDSEILLIIVKDQVEMFLEDQSISIVHKAIYEETLTRLQSLLKEVKEYSSIKRSRNEQNKDFYGLKIENIAQATAGKDYSETIEFIKTTLIYRDIKNVSNDELVEIYLRVKDKQNSNQL